MAYKGLKIRNIEEDTCVEIMTECFNYLQEELGTETRIEFGRTAFWGKDAFHSGVYVHGNRQDSNYVCLNFRNLYGFPFSTILEVLGHEMRHAYQDQQGWFDAPENSMARRIKQKLGGIASGWWKGEYISRVAYKDLPWEKDANAYQKQYAQMCIDAGIINEKQLKMKIPGNKTQMPLEIDTHKWIEENYPNSHTMTAYSETTEEHEQRRVSAKQEARDKMVALGYKLIDNTWYYLGKKTDKLTKQERLDSREAYKLSSKFTLNPNPKRKVNKEGICYVTELDYDNYLEKVKQSKFKRGSQEAYDLYIELETLSQKNFVPWLKRSLTVEDLTC